ncbi:MAG: small subunit ribosomal protein S19 [Patescibacteria group bacterium]|jgi:small subunit ribosomal protein S19
MAEEIAKRSKEKFFRGIEMEELKKMDIREFAKLVKSRPRRAILRNTNIIEAFVQKCERCAEKKKMIKTHDRSLVIVPKMLGHAIHVYNGKEFLKVEIVSEMLGHRFGEFSLTRKIARHTKTGLKRK